MASIRLRLGLPAGGVGVNSLTVFMGNRALDLDNFKLSALQIKAYIEPVLLSLI